MKTIKVITTDSDTPREVPGFLAFFLYGFAWYVVRDVDNSGRYIIVELKSGCSITTKSFETVAEAIKESKKILREKGMKATKEATNEQISYYGVIN